MESLRLKRCVLACGAVRSSAFRSHSWVSSGKVTYRTVPGKLREQQRRFRSLLEASQIAALDCSRQWSTCVRNSDHTSTSVATELHCVASELQSCYSILYLQA
jgi:hypothetical protein